MTRRRQHADQTTDFFHIDVDGPKIDFGGDMVSISKELPALMIPTNAQQEPTPITVKNKPHAPHVPRILMMSVAHQLQTALLFANLMKSHAYLLAKTTMAANYRQYVL